jgi:hypothetical protein
MWRIWRPCGRAPSRRTGILASGRTALNAAVDAGSARPTSIGSNATRPAYKAISALWQNEASGAVLRFQRHPAAHYIGLAQLIIHGVPYLSVNMPKRCAQNVSCSGILIVPFSDSAL